MSIKVKIELITPEIAREFLSHNTSNRNIRQSAVDEYATEMTAHRWGVSPDAIGFDEEGAMTNGQHRCLAVIQSGQNVEMLVARGLPKLVNGCGDLFTQDITDAGRKRTVADQLTIKHGIPNATMVAAGARSIGQICCGQAKSFPIGQANGVLALYKPELIEIATIVKKSNPVKKAGVVGALAFAMKTAREQALSFAASLATGEGLKKGDPALTLRNWFIAHVLPAGGANCNRFAAEYTANCFYNSLQGNSVSTIKRGAIGLDFLRAKQRSNVEKVRVICGE